MEQGGYYISISERSQSNSPYQVKVNNRFLGHNYCFGLITICTAVVMDNNMSHAYSGIVFRTNDMPYLFKYVFWLHIHIEHLSNDVDGSSHFCYAADASTKVEMVTNNEICSSAAKLGNNRINGRAHSNFAVSYCTFCRKS